MWRGSGTEAPQFSSVLFSPNLVSMVAGEINGRGRGTQPDVRRRVSPQRGSWVRSPPSAVGLLCLLVWRGSGTEAPQFSSVLFSPNLVSMVAGEINGRGRGTQPDIRWHVSPAAWSWVRPPLSAVGLLNQVPSK